MLTSTETSTEVLSDGHASPKRRRFRRETFSPKNIGAVYLWILVIVLFAIWTPDLFLQVQTAKNIANFYGITGLMALALILPLASGVFDLSIGATMAFTGIFAAWMLGNVTQNSLVVIAASLGAALLIGLSNAIVVVLFRIDSFIGTLATGAIIVAITSGISKEQVLFENVTESRLTPLAQTQWQGIQLPFLYMLVLAALLSFVLERTKFGRFSYATGFNFEAARLSGVPTLWIRAISLMTSSLIAGFAGLLLVGRIGSADPTSGVSYLIPAFAAAFAGATQFRGGRFNSWGAIVAVLLLGTGTVGLALAGAPSWAPQAFLGFALLIAIGATVRKKGSA